MKVCATLRTLLYHTKRQEEKEGVGAVRFLQTTPKKKSPCVRSFQGQLWNSKYQAAENHLRVSSSNAFSVFTDADHFLHRVYPESAVGVAE